MTVSMASLILNIYAGHHNYTISVMCIVVTWCAATVVVPAGLAIVMTSHLVMFGNRVKSVRTDDVIVGGLVTS